jgi:ABC-type bacteriocin/lantibiotic exporter with double-glycine peptidase domain
MQTIRRWLFLFICLISAACVHGQEMPVEEAQFTCGLNAAYLYLNRAGHHVAYDELVREFHEQTPPDSLLAIKNVLAKHGCPTVGIKADADYFLGKEGAAIVYLQLDGYSLHGERHFSFMVRASRENGVEFLDPIFLANKASLMTWDTFTRIYKGVALVAHE